MTKILHNIDIWFSCLVAMIKSMIEYRLDFIVGILSQATTQLVELIFLWIIFQQTGNVGGWNFYQLLLIYGIMMFAVAITDLLFDSMYDIGSKYIRDGDFDTILLRPIHPLISIMGQSRTITAAGYMIIAITIILITLIKLQIAITFILIFKILFFGIIGGIIIGAIITLFSVTSFWTHKSNEVMWSVFKIYTIAQYPISIYNKFIRILITCILPFAFVAYYPASNYLNFNNSYLLYLSPMVAIILWIIAVKVWNLGLNKYRSTGN